MTANRALALAQAPGQVTHRDKPIIFSGPMVRALLDGRKTQTRRVLKQQPCARDVRFSGMFGITSYASFTLCHDGGASESLLVRVPYAPGDRLYVREAHSLHGAHGQHRSDGQRWGPWGGLPSRVSPDGAQIAYFREGFDRSDPGRWRPSIHMPRWVSRLTLTVADVRVQRLQEISEEDARAEGVEPYRGHTSLPSGTLRQHTYSSHRLVFTDLWNSLHGPDAWAANPWVAAISFTVEKRNIDEVRP